MIRHGFCPSAAPVFRQGRAPFFTGFASFPAALTLGDPFNGRSSSLPHLLKGINMPTIPGKNIWANRRNGSRPIRRKNRFPAAKQLGNGTVIPANEPKAAPGIERIGRPLIARLRKSTGDFLCDGGSGRPQNGVRRVSQGSFQRPCAKNRPAGTAAGNKPTPKKQNITGPVIIGYLRQEKTGARKTLFGLFGHRPFPGLFFCHVGKVF